MMCFRCGGHVHVQCHSLSEIMILETIFHNVDCSHDI